MNLTQCYQEFLLLRWPSCCLVRHFSPEVAAVLGKYHEVLLGIVVGMKFERNAAEAALGIVGATVAAVAAVVVATQTEVAFAGYNFGSVAVDAEIAVAVAGSENTVVG